MTDKQIIIDGVDVAKCRCFTSEWDFNNCGHICKGTECKYKRLWYKKQLKRKEQECEKLNKKLKPKLKNAHCAYFDGQTGWCKAKEFIRCNPIGCKLYTIDELSTIVDLQQQLDQLKAENEELKKNLNEGCLQYLTLMTEQRVLLKTLVEIKEICNSVENIENINSLYDAKLSGMFLQANKILQKISKCEVKNERNRKIKN